METTAIKAVPRTQFGTKYTRHVRAAGQLPGIIYGHGQAPEPISLNRHDVQLALSHGAHLLKVEMNGKTDQYLIKEVQFDHLQHHPIHVDLARVDLNERVRVRVGLELRGTPKGLGHGGILELTMADMEVECLVVDIPEMIRPNVAHMNLGDSLLVKDVPLPPGVKSVADPDAIVATVRVIAEHVAAPIAVEGEAPQQPEVIGRGKEEAEEEAAEKKPEKKPEKEKK